MTMAMSWVKMSLCLQNNPADMLVLAYYLMHIDACNTFPFQCLMKCVLECR